MKYQIKAIGSGILLYEADTNSLRECVEKAARAGANLSRANLSRANLFGANLYEANLSMANLSGAYLSMANLSRANLSMADLSRANLSRANLSMANLSMANLSGAEGLNKYITTPMYLLLAQPNPIRAYKIVNSKYGGIYKSGLKYEVGKTISVDQWNDNEGEPCGAGINLASLDWCLREYRKGHKVLLCEFNREDIVCIPVGSDGKFRVKSCKVVKELDLDEYGVETGGE